MSRGHGKPKGHNPTDQPNPQRNASVVQAQQEQEQTPQANTAETQPRHWYAKLSQIKAEWVMAAFTIVLAATTIIYTYFTYGLWNVSVTQLRSSESTMRIQQRAWIGVPGVHIGPIVVGSTPVATVTIRNFGLSPGRDLSFKGEARIFDTPNFEMVMQSIEKRLADLPRPKERATLPPGYETPNITPAEFPISDNMLRQLKQKQAFLVMYGKIIYQDIFSKSHMTTFCTCLHFEGIERMDRCGRFDEMN